MQKPKYYIGADIGGTQSTWVITDNSAQPLNRIQGKGYNAHNQDYDPTSQFIKIFRQLTNGLTGPASCVIGIAALDTLHDLNFAHQMFHTVCSSPGLSLTITSCTLTSDVFIALMTGTSNLPAICLIAGTGSSCYGIAPDGQEHKAGNWGYLLGDQASGFSIGHTMLKAAVKELDGRKKITPLSTLVLDALDCKDLPSLIDYIYSQQNSIPTIASLTQLIPKLTDHPVVIAACQYIVTEMSQAIHAVHQRIQAPNTYSLVCSGSLFKLDQQIRKPLAEKLKQSHTQPSITHVTDPVNGAIHIAQQYQTILLPKLSTQIEL